MGTPTAVLLQPAYDDCNAVLDVIRSGGPFWPLSSYGASPEEIQALGGSANSFTPPWFRQDFALGGTAHVAGAELILHNERFVEAAREVYGEDAVVRPTTVYVNVMGPTPFAFAPHLDVPAFRGFTRADQPIWLLKVMKTSGLFEPWRVRIATAVSWFYAGPGGDFHYWPDGPDGPSAVQRPPFDNVAVVADNESTFHGVAPVGPPQARMPMGLTRESLLVRGDGGWDVTHGGEVVTHYDDSTARITVSWKADVFADAAAARDFDSGNDHLDLETVMATLTADMRSRGIDVADPAGDVHDRDWVGALALAYRDLAPAIA
jgi:hypothetical protein